MAYSKMAYNFDELNTVNIWNINDKVLYCWAFDLFNHSDYHRELYRNKETLLPIIEQITPKYGNTFRSEAGLWRNTSTSRRL